MKTKRIIGMIAAVSVLLSLFAFPASAREVSFSNENTDVLIMMLTNNAAKMNADLADFVKVQSGPDAAAIVASQSALVASKIAQINRECAQNHLQFLEGKVYNAKQLEQTRLVQLNNFKGLNAVMPNWLREEAQAQKEYDLCVAQRVAAENYLAAARVKLAPYL